jgi:hypothetical protein
MAFSPPRPPDVTCLRIKVSGGTLPPQRGSRDQTHEKDGGFNSQACYDPGTSNSRWRSLSSPTGYPSLDIRHLLPFRRASQSHVVFAELAFREPDVCGILDALSFHPVASLPSPT